MTRVGTEEGGCPPSPGLPAAGAWKEGDHGADTHSAQGAPLGLRCCGALGSPHLTCCELKQQSRAHPQVHTFTHFQAVTRTLKHTLYTHLHATRGVLGD